MTQKNSVSNMGYPAPTMVHGAPQDGARYPSCAIYYMIFFLRICSLDQRCWNGS